MKCLKLSNIASILPFLLAGLITISCLPEAVTANSAFEYFGSDIDYWGNVTPEPKPSPDPARKSAASGSETAGSLAEKSKESPSFGGEFPWHQYLDPKSKDFFKEGDYTPPEPFMEIVRNPSDTNLKMWFAYIDKRNQLSNRLQTRMKEYMEKNGAQPTDTGHETLKTRMAAIPQSVPDAKRFRFRMYFDSHCPHCHRMFGTLSELQAKGFYVEARQVDSDPKGLEGLSLPAQRASAEEVKEKGIQSVPLLLVGDLERKAVYRLTGFQTVSSIFQAINDHGGTQ